MPAPNRAQILSTLKGMMLPIDEFAPYLKAILYGDSGVGKTVLSFKVAQAITPADKLIMYVDSAQGGAVLLNHPELSKRVRRIQWQNLAQMDALVDAIGNKEDVFGSVGTIILDEFSNMVDSDLDDIMKVRASKDSSSSPDQAQLTEYNQNQNRMKRLVTALVAVDIHVILVAHEGKEMTPNGLPRTGPNFRAKFGPIVKQPQHLIGYVVADQIEANGEVVYRRAVQVQPTKKVDAKSRVGTLSGVSVNADALPVGIARWLDSGGKMTTENQPTESDTDATDPTDDTFTGIEA